MNESRAQMRPSLLILFLVSYLALGIYTELGLVAVKPIPEGLLEDFGYYARAVADARAGQDPYAIRLIGPAFLYPPPALAVVELFSAVRPFLLRVLVFSAANIALLVIMVHGVAGHYGYRLKDTWHWYVLGLGFAPFLELLHIGQINMITLFGLFMMFHWAETSAAIGGAGLALAAITKVTPLAFLPYLLAGRRHKVVAVALACILLATALSAWRYGPDPVLKYPEVFRGLLQQFPVDPNAQSLVSKLAVLDPVRFSAYRTIQTALTGYALAVIALSAFLAWTGKQALEPLFIITGLATMLSPNVVWYHHYVFMLLPLLIWMAWSRLNPRVVAWCLAGLLIVQIDRRHPPYGLLIHVFGHLSLLALVTGQALAWRRTRKGAGECASTGAPIAR